MSGGLEIFYRRQFAATSQALVRAERQKDHGKVAEAKARADRILDLAAKTRTRTAPSLWQKSSN